MLALGLIGSAPLSGLLSCVGAIVVQDLSVPHGSHRQAALEISTFQTFQAQALQAEVVNSFSLKGFDLRCRVRGIWFLSPEGRGLDFCFAI